MTRGPVTRSAQASLRSAPDRRSPQRIRSYQCQWTICAGLPLHRMRLATTDVLCHKTDGCRRADRTRSHRPAGLPTAGLLCPCLATSQAILRERSSQGWYVLRYARRPANAGPAGPPCRDVPQSARREATNGHVEIFEMLCEVLDTVTRPEGTFLLITAEACGILPFLARDCRHQPPPLLPRHRR